MANRYVRSTGGNYNAAGTWESTPGGGETVAVPAATDDVIATAASGQLTITATAVAKSFDGSAYANTLTHNTGVTWTVSGSVNMGAGMTYTPVGSPLLRFNASGTLTTSGSQLPVRVSTVTGGTLTLGTNITFANSVFSQFSLGSSTSINLNGKTMSGYSATRRVLIDSGTVGTSRTFATVTDTSFQHADFRDVKFGPVVANANIDLTNGGALVMGDCGGLSILGTGTLTKTASAAQDLTMSANKSWSDATIWTSRVPLPQDDVTATGWTAGTLTADMPRLGRSIDFSGATAGRTLTLGNAVTSYAGLNMTNVSTLTGTFVRTLEGRGNFTITSAGNTFPGVDIVTVGGKYTLLDSFISTGNLRLGTGTLDTNDVNVTCARLSYNVAPLTNQTFTFGSSTITATSTGSVFEFAAGNTITAHTATMIISDVSSTAKSFIGAGKTFHNLEITGTGTGAITISGSNTFNSITVGNPKTLILTAATTQNVASFTATGTAGSEISLKATAGVVPVLNYTGAGKVQCDYLNIQGVNVTPASTWYYGNNSVDGIGLFFDGTNDVVTFGNLGNITNVTLNMIMRVDNNEILTVNGATTGAVTVAAGVLTFGADLSGSNITVDGVSKTAAEAGVLLNNNLPHALAFDLTSVAASDFRLGTNSSAYGELFVNGLSTTGHTWSFTDDPAVIDTGANDGTISGALVANTGWNSGLIPAGGRLLLLGVG